jgi:hypothetical protein
MNTRRIIEAIIFFGLIGFCVFICLKKPYTEEPSIEKQSNTVSISTENSIYETTLSDGTRCIFVYRGGIDCEWKDNPPQGEEK